jgi:hypothetical protein
VAICTRNHKPQSSARNGPQADLNLGIKTFLNGKLIFNIVLDTVDYVATDSAGLTSTSTRTVIIEPAAASVVPTDNASSTNEATSTVQ